MNRSICVAAFAVGLAVVGWVGAGYVGASPLALVMTALIGAVYIAGAFELLRFQRDTAALVRELEAISDPPAHPGEWLGRLPAALQNPVRLRIEGERVALPGPALTPYLVGLLVLLGMLGTFLGMVVTLNGAVIALEGTTDLQSIRASLAAPVKGLGVAFGTSVAGVTASAMLGLISALSRRARLHAAQLLDTRIATVLRGFSRAHQREEVLKAVQRQAEVLPALVDKLGAMMAQMEARQQEASERQFAGQERFHQDARSMYAELAASVDRSLKDSLTASARLAGEVIQPAVQATMDGIARETTALQERVAEAVTAQLDGLSNRFDASVAAVADTWTKALASHERSSAEVSRQLQDALAAHVADFGQRAAALLSTVEGTHAALLATLQNTAASLQTEIAARDDARQSAFTATLETMAATLQQQWQQAGERGAAQQEEICRTLAATAGEIAAASQAQARSTAEEIARLMHAAAEAPRAAAEAIGELRRELSASLARDNAMLAERGRIMETLGALLDTITHASTEQRAAIDALIASSTAMLEEAGKRFAAGIETESARMTEAAGEVSGGAIEVASLAEAFGVAVQLFGESSDKLMTTLARVEGALEKSLARSDEQLAYYVAQARELIDLSILSQKQVVDDLQRLAAPQAALAGGA